MTSITVEEELLHDLKLVKRVLGTKNMTDTIRFLMNARNYDEKWLEYMAGVLKGESE